MELNKVRNLRYIVLVVMRVAAVVLLVGGFYPLITLVILSWDGTSLLIFFDNGFSWLAYTLGLWVPGIVLAYKGRSISKWVVPTPRHECLSCGYYLKSLKADHCPECGSPIPTANQTPSKKEDQ